MREMSAKGLGASAIVDAAGRVLGIFTDGDLRRLIEKGIDLRGEGARRDAPGPRTIRNDALAAEAAAADGAVPHHQRAGGRRATAGCAAPSTATT
jgi:arabinose-5-phosphate isomerase